jgi:hypothetical protein
MSKFKPGDIVHYMDGDILCQGVICVEDDKWPLVPDGYCFVYPISPEYGTREWKHKEDNERYCDMIPVENLYSSPEDLISHIKGNLKHEYDKKINVLDAYVKGSTKQKQTLAEKVREIFLGYNIEDQ